MGEAHVAVVGPEALDDCLAIRRVVFIEGQDVPEDLEVDGRDPECVHILARLRDRPVATARLRPVPGGGKVERVAVLPGLRGRHLGLRVMEVLLDAARARGLSRLWLHAQAPVVDWYRAQGWEAYGAPFDEAGIPHRKMRLRLD